MDPNNQIAGDGTFTYTYDDEGNLLTKTRVSGASADDHLTEYTWDYHNRLTQVTLKNNSGTVTQRIEYSYDAFDRLIGRKKFIGTSTTASLSQHFVYDGNQIILMLDDSAAVQQRYLWGPSVDMLLAQEDGSNNVLWALGDHENSTSDWISYDAGTETTSFVDHSQFDAFGNRMNTPTVESIFGWTGRFVDADTGLQWNNARWYDPHQGRWMSEDPIGFNGGTPSLYCYCGNDPVNAADPSGLAAWLFPWEDGASWNPINTAKLWFGHTPGEHYNGLMTGETNPKHNVRENALSTFHRATIGSHTIGMNFGGAFGILPFSGTGSYGVHVGVDNNGFFSWGHGPTLGGGVCAGWGVSGGPSITITNAPNVGTLTGPGNEAGAFPLPISRIWGDNGSYQGWQVGGFGGGFGPYYNRTYSWYWGDTGPRYMPPYGPINVWSGNGNQLNQGP